MPLNKSLKKVMVIGSGPIVIGQAAEFDYAGTQACRALKEEGLDVYKRQPQCYDGGYTFHVIEYRCNILQR